MNGNTGWKWQQPIGRLKAQVGWLGLRVSSHLAFSLHCINRVNYCNGLAMMTALSLVLSVILVYLDIAAAAIALVWSISISVELELRFPIDRIVSNDADFCHELFELFEGDVVGQATHVHITVLFVVNLKPRWQPTQWHYDMWFDSSCLRSEEIILESNCQKLGSCLVRVLLKNDLVFK